MRTLGRACQVLVLPVALCGFGLNDSKAAAQGEVLSMEGSVGLSHSAAEWAPATIGQQLVVQDRVRTLASSRAMLRLAELGRLRLNELTTLEVMPPRENSSGATLDLKAGAMYFFTRERPRTFQIQVPFAMAASRGTEFVVSVASDGRATFTVFDGVVGLTNALGSVVLNTGEIGTVDPGKAPVKTAVIQASNLVQWWLYYPGVLDASELTLTPIEQALLASSLTAYRDGDLRRALENYPKGRIPQSQSERVYLAGLLLSVGQVDRAQAQLAAGDSSSSIAAALRELIAATSRPGGIVTNRPPASATEWLARSYAQQSAHDLAGALASANAAAAQSPTFGFAWERVAELEFSFGRREQGLAALAKALKVSPQNAQAWALKGFLAAAGNRMTEAEEAFNTAIKLDPALGNGWLGRGLVRIHRGDAAGGRADLQTAAAMEPDRSLLRSYLAKAFANVDDDAHAHQELGLAQRLDGKDPTPWLYLALLDYQENRTSQAVDDLGRTLDLNTNRQVYRSKLLLDQDRAVASTSLAKIYQDAAMNDVSVAEASRAVDYDYANYSAHLFLAESYDALRDPTRFNLRYETAWFNELLLANLLAPVGARPISQNISQQEYSRLLEEDGFGLDTTSQYRSDRQLQELASQYGAFGATSYSLDLTYQHNDGILHPYRPNNDLSDIEWYSQIKQQVGPSDAVTLFTKYENYHSGDNFQYNNVTNASRYFRYNEYETPIMVGAWHHEWDPGVHTLFLAGRLVDDQTFTDQNVQSAVVDPENIGARQFTNFSYQNQFEIYTAEVNQLFQSDRHTSILGARFQTGQFNTQDLLSGVADNPAYAPPVQTNVVSAFRRASAYGYHSWEIFPRFVVTAGAAYDEITYPANFRFVPITGGETRREQVSPKLAAVWTPLPEITFRGALAESLSGASFDESFTLEPTQIAGFIQEYRSIVSESLVGSVAGARNKIWGAAMDLKLPLRTYLTIQGQVLGTDVNENVGVFDLTGASSPSPGTVPDHLRYEEPALTATINKLVGNDCSIGLSYKYTCSTLSVSDPFALGLSGQFAGETAPLPVLNAPARFEAQLHEVDPYVQLAYPWGLFARADADWHLQFNSGYTPGTGTPDAPLPRSEFTQVNLYAGYRFWHRRGEATFGVLNVGGRNYSLNPLNAYAELPRSRVFMGRLRFNF